MLENIKDIWKKESKQRQAEALRRRSALKLHQITVEHGVNLDRHNISILGFDMEQDINDWKVAAQLKVDPNTMKRLAVVGQETRCDQIHFIPPRVREKLAWDFVSQFTKEQKEKMLKALKDDLNEKK